MNWLKYLCNRKAGITLATFDDYCVAYIEPLLDIYMNETDFYDLFNIPSDHYNYVIRK